MSLIEDVTLEELHTKRCPICNKIKSQNEFNLDAKAKDGLHTYCRECDKVRKIQYYRTEEGLANKLFSNQNKSSARRGLPKPQYTKEEFKIWLFNDKNFKPLFKQWEKHEYDVDYTPSVDRIDDYKPYGIGNVQLTTWKENNDRAKRDRKNGINNKVNKGVHQYTLEGDFKNYYYSISQASRQTHINLGNIVSACKGTYKTAGGFVWRYADESVKETITIEDFILEEDLVILEELEYYTNELNNYIKNHNKVDIVIEDKDEAIDYLMENNKRYKEMSMSDLYMSDKTIVKIALEEKKNIKETLKKNIGKVIDKIVALYNKILQKSIMLFGTFNKKIEVLIKQVKDSGFEGEYDKELQTFINEKLGLKDKEMTTYITDLIAKSKDKSLYNRSHSYLNKKDTEFKIETKNNNKLFLDKLKLKDNNVEIVSAIGTNVKYLYNDNGLKYKSVKVEATNTNDFTKKNVLLTLEHILKHNTQYTKNISTRLKDINSLIKLAKVSNVKDSKILITANYDKLNMSNRAISNYLATMHEIAIR